MKQRIFKKGQLESFLNDQSVFEAVLEKMSKGEIAITDGLREQAERAGESLDQPESRLESMSASPVSPGAFSILEAIVLREGRPPLLVKDDTYEKPKIEELRTSLDKHADKINPAIKSVARLEVLNHPSFTYFGTAWMIDEDVMITNRHVAQMFAYRKGKRFFVRTDAFGNPFQTQVDFREEHEQTLPSIEVEVVEVLHMERDAVNHPDMALIRVKKSDKLPPPLVISPHGLFAGQPISVIGYPAKDGLRNDAKLMSELFGDIYQVKRLSPGLIAGVVDDQFVFAHDCTTLGGNSGSVVISNETGQAIGLHFSGSFMESNYAVKGSAILKILSDNSTSSTYGPSTFEMGGTEAAPTVEDLASRTGYDADFLDDEVALPGFVEGSRDRFATLRDSDETELKYTHYSVKMHAKRKMAAYTASNIDGNLWFQIPRGRDKWYFDPRMEEEKQIGNDFYRGNNMHRGHLVRRLDPAWGDDREIALLGVEDTFYWTNCTPQHRNFNPRSWLRLEDYVLRNAVNHDLKVSVFTGPVFKSRDKRYRGHRIPEDYWKVLAFNHIDRGQLSATAYLLSQSEFMDDVEFVYGAYRTYQVPIQKIIDLTDIDFSALINYDPLARNEAIPYMEIVDNEEMIL